ncbi:hypothetical protein TA3x_003517 [Tundrisphaera sp. TA3]|uniref:hypothetical protein n=1 Tax=Tundrisphaera sp. TA3 TaxID=3435775 RepID=UPI003EB9659A
MRRLYHEFIISGIVTGESGRITFVGRCGDYPIRVGDTLDSAFRYRPRKLPEEAALAPELVEIRPIHWKVIQIHAYEQYLPELGPGMTGSLTLEGASLAGLEPGWILGQKDRNAAITPDSPRYTVSDGNLTLILDRLEEGGYHVTTPIEPRVEARTTTIEEAFREAYTSFEELLMADAKAAHARHLARNRTSVAKPS